MLHKWQTNFHRSFHTLGDVRTPLYGSHRSWIAATRCVTSPQSPHGLWESLTQNTCQHKIHRTTMSFRSCGYSSVSLVSSQAAEDHLLHFPVFLSFFTVYFAKDQLQLLWLKLYIQLVLRVARIWRWSRSLQLWPHLQFLLNVSLQEYARIAVSTRRAWDSVALQFRNGRSTLD